MAASSAQFDLTPINIDFQTDNDLRQMIFLYAAAVDRAAASNLAEEMTAYSKQALALSRQVSTPTDQDNSVFAKLAISQLKNDHAAVAHVSSFYDEHLTDYLEVNAALKKISDEGKLTYSSTKKADYYADLSFVQFSCCVTYAYKGDIKKAVEFYLEHGHSIEQSVLLDPQSVDFTTLAKCYDQLAMIFKFNAFDHQFFLFANKAFSLPPEMTEQELKKQIKKTGREFFQMCRALQMQPHSIFIIKEMVRFIALFKQYVAIPSTPASCFKSFLLQADNRQLFDDVYEQVVALEKREQSLEMTLSHGPALVKTLMQQIEALKAELDALTKEKSAAKEMADQLGKKVDGMMEAMTRRKESEASAPATLRSPLRW